MARRQGSIKRHLVFSRFHKNRVKILVHIITIGGSTRQSRNARGNCFVLKPVRSGVDHRSEEIRIAQAVDLIGPELIWLATERNLDNPDGQLGDETGGD